MAKDALSYDNPFYDFPEDLPEDFGNNDAPLMLDKCDDGVFDDDDYDDDDDCHFSNEVDDSDVHAGDESMLDQETTTLDRDEWMASDQEELDDCERSRSPTLGTNLYRRLHPDDCATSQSNSERHAQLCGMTGGLDQVLKESFTLGEKRGPSGTPPLAQPQQSSTKIRRSTSRPQQDPSGPQRQQAQGPQPTVPSAPSALHILQHSQLGSSRTRTVDEAKFGRYREPPPLLRNSSTLSSSSDEQSTGASDATLPSYATPFRRALSSGNLSSGNLGSTSMSHPFATPARRPASITPYLRSAVAVESSSSATTNAMVSSSNRPLAMPAIYHTLTPERPAMPATHHISSEWEKLYSTVALGTIPTPEQCKDAPPTQQPLSVVPIAKTTRYDSILGHFFKSISNVEFQCQAKNEDGTICGQVYKKSGGGTTRDTHIRNYHAAQHDAIIEFRRYQGISQKISVALTDHAQKKTTFKETREEIIRKNIIEPLPQEIAEFHARLVDLIAIRGASFGFIGSDEFKDMCHTLNPRVGLPTGDVLKKKMSSLVSDMQARLKKWISRFVRYGAITLDSWTSRDQRKFLGVTFHFLSPNFTAVSVVIGMERIEGPQTSLKITETLNAVLTRWDLKDKIICATTDQGANIKKAMRDYGQASDGSGSLSMAWLPCSSHQMQLCINKALEAALDASLLIGRCQKISNIFRNFRVANDALKAAMASLQQKPLKMQTATITRWNSKYYMAKRVSDLMPAVEIAFHCLRSGTSHEERRRSSELESLLFSEEESIELKEVIGVLDPLCAFTHWATAVQHPTLPRLYPKILEILAAPCTETTGTAKQLRASIEEHIKSTWQFGDPPDIAVLAMFFNPACICHPIMQDSSLTDGCTVLEKGKQLAKKAVITLLEEKERAKSGQSTFTKTASATIELLSTLAVTIYEAQSKDNRTDLIAHADDPGKYWSKLPETIEYSNMKQVARWYLCIQATSAESERLFSKAGQVLSERKTNTSDRVFRDVVFYSSFKKTLKLLRLEMGGETDL